MPSREFFEVIVIVFQVVGVIALLLARLSRGTVWSAWSATSVVASMIVLGLAGGVCATHDSEFSIFAGGTIAILLHGMILGPIGPTSGLEPSWSISGESAAT